MSTPLSHKKERFIILYYFDIQDTFFFSISGRKKARKSVSFCLRVERKKILPLGNYFSSASFYGKSSREKRAEEERERGTKGDADRLLRGE